MSTHLLTAIASCGRAEVSARHHYRPCVGQCL